MKSVGEVMAIGRTFQESLQKALRGLEVGSSGFEHMIDVDDEDCAMNFCRNWLQPTAERIWYIGDAFRAGMSVDEIYKLSGVDPWFLVQIEDIIRREQSEKYRADDIDADHMFRLKRKGFSDERLAVSAGVG